MLKLFGFRRCYWPHSRLVALFAILSFVFPAIVGAVADPAQTATIVVRGFDSQGASRTGAFGVDLPNSDIAALAWSIGLPMSTDSPLAANQVGYTDYYGTAAPPYYTQADIDEVAAVTAQYGGGVPRYALIVAKYAREVMRRSGAKQVNLFGVSFGGLVSRWMVEKDVGGLVSSGKIARWIAVEGVVNGNWICSQGSESMRDFVSDNFDLSAADVEHMTYEWVQTNLHNPHNSSDNPLLGTMPIFFWQPSDDDYNSKALTISAQRANDGVQLLRDEWLQNLPAQSLYLDRIPMRSAIHATHESSKDHLGIRAGVAAQLFGRRRVTVTLNKVYIRNDMEISAFDNGEFVFGLRVFSPQAQTQYGIAQPIQELRHDDNNLVYIELPDDTTSTIGLHWFDDMVLPGESVLNLQTNVDEIDFDLVYGIEENPFDTSTGLSDTAFQISTLAGGTCFISTPDWDGEVVVSILDYPPYDPLTSAASGWELYE